MGIESRKEDLGQAMGANGMAPGPHIVLPIIGPSNLRDATGDVLTSLTSPVTAAASAADSAVSYAENKDDIKAASDSALDPYVVERDGYEQHREYQVQNGEVAPTDVPTIVADD
jgi:phospholipid-binding lipoprotein MlaA